MIYFQWRNETLSELRTDIYNLSNIEPLSSVKPPSLYVDGNVIWFDINQNWHRKITFKIFQKPCKRPNLNRCPPGTTKKGRKRKKGKRSKKGKKSKKSKKSKGGRKSKKQKRKSRRPKKRAIPLSSDTSWVTLIDTESIKKFPNLFNNGPYLLASKKKRKGKKKKKSRTVEKGKCKKVLDSNVPFLAIFFLILPLLELS